MLIDVADASHIGKKKDKNEDSHGLFDENFPELRLFKQGMLLAVADGLGGHIGGDIASKLAISMLRDALKELAPAEEDRGSEREDAYYLSVLEAAMHKANESIYKTNFDLVKSKRPMGTTLCAALIRPKIAYLGNVGDSRAYLCRKGRFIARTEDHSWVDEQVKNGLMTPAEAQQDKRKNLLTRSIGTHPEIQVDTYQWRIEAGDQLLLCTDGLTNMVPDDAILEVLQQPATAREKADRLIDLANENGGKDNITVIAAEINPNPRRLRRLKRRAWLRKHQDEIKRIVYILCYGLVCFLAGLAAGLVMR